MAESKLALLGGKKVVTMPARDMFTWPIITKEDEKAVLDVLRRTLAPPLSAPLCAKKKS